MSYYPNSYPQGYPYAQPYGSALDVAAIMRRVYLWLAVGLAIGFGIAYMLGSSAAAGNTTAVAILFNPVIVIVALLAYLILGFGFFPIVRRVNLSVATVLYLAFAAVFGFLISDVFVVYTTGSIWQTFLTTAAMFGVMALLGYTTRLDLSKIGAILFMALIGVIVASLVNLFLQSTALYWIITYIGVALFCGLTAYDVQWIKRQAVSVAGTSDEVTVGRIALLGAFRLFLDFINLFLFLLRIIGRANRS